MGVGTGSHRCGSYPESLECSQRLRSQTGPPGPGSDIHALPSKLLQGRCVPSHSAGNATFAPSPSPTRTLHNNGSSHLSASPRCHCQTRCSHLSLDKKKKKQTWVFLMQETFSCGSTNPRVPVQRGCFHFFFFLFKGHEQTMSLSNCMCFQINLAVLQMVPLANPVKDIGPFRAN